MRIQLNNGDNKCHVLLISDVSGTMRDCNPEGINANGCKTQLMDITVGKKKSKIVTQSGQNWMCSCVEDFCNNSPTWLEKTKPLYQTQQHDVTWYSSDTPIDSEGVLLIEKSMSTQSIRENTLPVNYNDHSTDKIQSNGVKALNDDIMFVTLLTLLINIFW